MDKYHLVHIAGKGASWVLRAEELEAEKREGTYTKSSFASLETLGAATPSFGRVQHFFQHSFAGQCHDFAVVNLYGRPQQDARSRLWYVPTTTVAGRSVLRSASSPNHLSQHLMLTNCGFLISFNVYHSNKVHVI